MWPCAAHIFKAIKTTRGLLVKRKTLTDKSLKAFFVQCLLLNYTDSSIF